MKDKLYQNPGRRETAFAFDEEVAAVFDDMLQRSIPFYFELQNMIADLVDEFVPDSGKIYDLGCSTGVTIGLLDNRIKNKSIEFEGVDNSPAMLQRAAQNLASLNINNFKLVERDLNQGIEIVMADAVILNLVLQFVDPERRLPLIKNIHSGLNKSGCLILVEKISIQNKKLNSIYTDAYYEFKKRNLYTDQEIASKRKALESILVPNQFSDNIKLLKKAGFACIEVFFCWFNFCGLIAVKD